MLPSPLGPRRRGSLFGVSADAHRTTQMPTTEMDVPKPVARKEALEEALDLFRKCVQDNRVETPRTRRVKFGEDTEEEPLQKWVDQVLFPIYEAVEEAEKEMDMIRTMRLAIRVRRQRKGHRSVMLSQNVPPPNNSWWPVYRWNLAYKNPGYIPSIMASLTKQTGIHTYPVGIRLSELKSEVRDRILRRRARLLKPPPFSVDEEVEQELDRELDARWADCHKACLNAKRRLGQLTFDMCWIGPGQALREVPSLNLFFASKPAEKKAATLGEFVLILQCNVRCLLARRARSREEQRAREESSGWRRELVERRLAMSFALMRAQQFVRKWLVRRAIRKKEAAAQCLDSLAKFCSGKGFTDAFADFFDDHCRSFVNQTPKSEHDTLHFELYQVYLLHLEMILSRFCEKEGVQYAALVEFCDTALVEGSKAARRFVKELRILSQYSSFVKLMATAAQHGGGAAFRFREQAHSYALLRVFGASRTWSEEQKDEVIMKAEEAVRRAGLKFSVKPPSGNAKKLWEVDLGSIEENYGSEEERDSILSNFFHNQREIAKQAAAAAPQRPKEEKWPPPRTLGGGENLPVAGSELRQRFLDDFKRGKIAKDEYFRLCQWSMTREEWTAGEWALFRREKEADARLKALSAVRLFEKAQFIITKLYFPMYLNNWACLAQRSRVRRAAETALPRLRRRFLRERFLRVWRAEGKAAAEKARAAELRSMFSAHGAGMAARRMLAKRRGNEAEPASEEPRADADAEQTHHAEPRRHPAPSRLALDPLDNLKADLMQALREGRLTEIQTKQAYHAASVRELEKILDAVVAEMVAVDVVEVINDMRERMERHLAATFLRRIQIALCPTLSDIVGDFSAPVPFLAHPTRQPDAAPAGEDAPSGAESGVDAKADARGGSDALQLDPPAPEAAESGIPEHRASDTGTIEAGMEAARQGGDEEVQPADAEGAGSSEATEQLEHGDGWARPLARDDGDGQAAPLPAHSSTLADEPEAERNLDSGDHLQGRHRDREVEDAGASAAAPLPAHALPPGGAERRGASSEGRVLSPRQAAAATADDGHHPLPVAATSSTSTSTSRPSSLAVGVFADASVARREAIRAKHAPAALAPPPLVPGASLLRFASAALPAPEQEDRRDRHSRDDADAQQPLSAGRESGASTARAPEQRQQPLQPEQDGAAVAPPSVAADREAANEDKEAEERRGAEERREREETAEESRRAVRDEAAQRAEAADEDAAEAARGRDGGAAEMRGAWAEARGSLPELLADDAPQEEHAARSSACGGAVHGDRKSDHDAPASASPRAELPSVRPVPAGGVGLDAQWPPNADAPPPEEHATPQQTAARPPRRAGPAEGTPAASTTTVATSGEPVPEGSRPRPRAGSESLHTELRVVDSPSRPKSAAASTPPEPKPRGPHSAASVAARPTSSPRERRVRPAATPSPRRPGTTAAARPKAFSDLSKIAALAPKRRHPMPGSRGGASDPEGGGEGVGAWSSAGYEDQRQPGARSGGSGDDAQLLELPSIAGVRDNGAAETVAKGVHGPAVEAAAPAPPSNASPRRGAVHQQRRAKVASPRKKAGKKAAQGASRSEGEEDPRAVAWRQKVLPAWVAKRIIVYYQKHGGGWHTKEDVWLLLEECRASKAAFLNCVWRQLQPLPALSTFEVKLVGAESAREVEHPADLQDPMGLYFLARSKKPPSTDIKPSPVPLHDNAHVGGINADIERERNRRNALLLKQQELRNEAKVHVRSLFVMAKQTPE